MSIKDELRYVKDELSSDEKLLENAFKLERFYKKHRIKIWITLVLLIGGFGGKAISDTYKEYKLNIANNALLVLQDKSDDAKALGELKDANPKLYNLYVYFKSVNERDISTLETLSKGSDKLILDLAKYHLSVLKNKPGNSKYYNDLSIVEKAYENIKSGNKKKAKEQLSLIDINSPLIDIANLLKHSTLK